MRKALAVLLMNRRIWLALLMLWVVNYHARIAYQVIDDLRHGESKPGLPLTFGFQTQAVSGTTSEAYEAGVRDGDVLETVNGDPFNCFTKPSIAASLAIPCLSPCAVRRVLISA
jgi:hypothetical protein